jgi:hypothetical protein
VHLRHLLPMGQDQIDKYGGLKLSHDEAIVAADHHCDDARKASPSLRVYLKKLRQTAPTSRAIAERTSFTLRKQLPAISFMRLRED